MDQLLARQLADLAADLKAAVRVAVSVGQRLDELVESSAHLAGESPLQGLGFGPGNELLIDEDARAAVFDAETEPPREPS